MYDIPEAGAGNMPVIEGFIDLVQIGRGGFGTVYRGHQRDIGRTVAIKVLNGSAHDREAQRRFQREVTAMGAISHHPNVVPVYGIGTAADGRPFLVMPYLPGGSLADRLGTLSWRQTADLGSKMAGALQAAHHVGVLHRDVKPANILWSAWNEPQLADFGIARLHDTTRTAPGLVIASLTWAAPEVLEGRPATPASDVYSLAAALHAAITGRAPHAPGPDEPMATTVARIASEPAADLRAFGVPGQMSELISASLAKHPASRPPTARAFGDALVAAATAEWAPGPAPAPVPAVEPTVPVEPVVVVTPASERARPSRTVVSPTISAPIDRQTLTADGGGWIDNAPARERRRPVVVAVLGACVVLVLLGLLVQHFMTDAGQPSGSSAGRRNPTSAAPPTSSGTTAGGASSSTPPTSTSAPDTSSSPSTTQRSSTTTTTSSTTSTTTASTTSTNTPTAPSTTAPASIGQGGAATVRATLLGYYDRVGRGDYTTTWSRLTAAYQRRTGGYASYTRFWRNYDGVEVTNLRAEGDLAARATLRYHQTNGATVQETGRFQFVHGPSGELLIDAYRVSGRTA